MLASRAVVGLGELTLLLAHGAVIMYANGTTMEAFRESEVLWWVLLDDYLAGFREKKILPEGCRWSGSSTGSQQHFWFPESLNVANTATMEAFRVSKVLWWVLSVFKKIGVAEGRG